MADSEEFVSDSPSTPSGKGKKLLIIGVAGFMLLEGVGLFLLTKMMYQQPEAAQATITEEEKALQNVQEEIELTLPELSSFNKREGRLFIYKLVVTIRVPKDSSEEIQKILEARESTILDRFNTVIRSAETKYLNEPGLDTIRRQFRFELEKILGDDELILELLIPKFFQSPVND